ncbi:hypothetical protein [Pseudomonas sp. Irchel s3f19]|uniref:hypothetical protein n=1 Tax=Pseudomonas sp. Irchel s3f19 TaxID=2009146 RepID=UPI000BA401D3|nr:hypothetical protein [Pseudomonas sp. Irchel s3f19]
MKSLLQKLFDCTQTELAKAIGAWVVIPFALAMANRGMEDLALVTYEIVQAKSCWQSFPYVVAFAAMLCALGCFRIQTAKMKRKHKLF